MSSQDTSGHCDQKINQDTTSHRDQKSKSDTSSHRDQKWQDKLDKKIDKSKAKAAKNRKKLYKAKRKLPKKTGIRVQRRFDDTTGKAKHSIVLEKTEKKIQKEKLHKKALRRAKAEAVSSIHNEIHKVETDNAAVEGAHKTEEAIEDVAFFVKRYKKSKLQRRQAKYRKLSKNQYKKDAKLAYQEFIKENPELSRQKSMQHEMQKQLQKKKIKREYAKAAKGAEGKAAKETASRAADTATGIAKKLQEWAESKQRLFIGIGIFGLILVLVVNSFSSCGSIFSGTVGMILSSTYLSNPSDIDAVELAFTQKEMQLQNRIDGIERENPGYDEYDYNIGTIGHDPFTLISFLSAKYNDFTAEQVMSVVQDLFNSMYSFSTKAVTETRYRTVTKTGKRVVRNAKGELVEQEYTYQEQEAYTVRILRVTLTTTPLETVVSRLMDTDTAELYSNYNETKGGLQVFGSPVDLYWYYYVSSYYGYRKNPSTGAQELHRGVDIAIPVGTTIYAGCDGTVTTAGYNDFYGNYIEISDDEGYKLIYAHLNSLQVSRGQTVSIGQSIGASGNSGSSVGSQLHIECLYQGQYYNPLFYFEAGSATLYGETTGGTSTNGVTPPDHYDDATVEKLIREGEKYLGMPYTFGGTPPKSFDCSGFVCWVYTNSGVHNLPRTTAQGIYDQCTPVSASEAKAGDLIFFTGTYDAGRPVTHVGIYCGNGVMLHCGSPIQYASINTSYWQSHFYSFGRLN